MLKLLKTFCIATVAVLGLSGAAFADHGNHGKSKFVNVIEIDSQFTERSVTRWISHINRAIKKGSKEIVLELNSPGGSIFAGNQLLHSILKNQTKGIKFIGVVKEYCMSMCFITLQFMNDRLSYPYSTLLDHPASGGANRAALVQIEELLKEIVNAKLRKAGKSALEIKLYNLLYSNEFYFNTKLALELGLLDRIIIPGQAIKNEPKSNKKSTK